MRRTARCAARAARPAAHAAAQDKDSKYRLILVESRIHRLSRYYKRTRVLPPDWKYESATASALIS